MKIYLLRNKENQYYRSKGFGGYGKSWVDDAQDAKVYTKIGSAKRQVTYWAKNHSEYGVPEILELEASVINILDQNGRVNELLKEQERRKNISKVNKLSEKFREAKERYDKAIEDLDNYYNEIDE